MSTTVIEKAFMNFSTTLLDSSASIDLLTYLQLTVLLFKCISLSPCSSTEAGSIRLLIFDLWRGWTSSSVSMFSLLCSFWKSFLISNAAEELRNRIRNVTQISICLHWMKTGKHMHFSVIFKVRCFSHEKQSCFPDGPEIHSKTTYSSQVKSLFQVHLISSQHDYLNDHIKYFFFQLDVCINPKMFEREKLTSWWDKQIQTVFAEFTLCSYSHISKFLVLINPSVNITLVNSLYYC